MDDEAKNNDEEQEIVAVVDYVVVHELCHLLEFNHTKDYWRHVSNNFRDYKECRDWLRVNGASLII